MKSISFRYTASQELSSLFEDFRLMCNDAVRIAITEKPRNRFELIEFAYSRLKEYGLHSHYIQNACEVAFSVYRNRNRESVPHIGKPFIKLDNQTYSLSHFLARIPTSPRRFVFLELHGSDYHRSFVDDENLKRGSITVTQQRAIISFSRNAKHIETLGNIGLDVNERNVTISATNGHERVFTELGEVVDIKERYREIRAKIGKTTRQDNRITKQLYAKYGEREKNRTIQRIHKVTKQLIDYAKENRLGIKMERLTGIRKLYRRGNGQGPSFRGRMNSWVFGETQRQIDYKAKWEGVPHWLVSPRGTSRNCPNCGSRVAQLQWRKLYCIKCDKTWDRDIFASKNIMACVVPQARPSKGSGEKERSDGGSNPSSRWAEVSQSVDKDRRATEPSGSLPIL
ncbi:MAG TPA: transposase [Nitrososphaerales archaeon]|nr:transposase [Nitrososphaerales archaeon]